MNIREEKRGDVLIYFMEKEISISNLEQMKMAFEDAVNRNEKKLLVDLSAVSFIDSAGLNMLMEAHKSLKKINGRLRLCGMNSKIKNVIEITNLHILFEIFDTQEQALKDF
jgi:anti-sigma B factor antagonist